ncbi:hypothetical protein DB30_05908 [Enhygromyxa salina]|uniref:CBM11 domain-containing protein n=1 Tax=Enhygromyxa salina TaxID=215803 RepID=A0A0C1ZW14_9BACT|nr:hypothetical protein [Enhygromyxa salina]KIG15208.1 hypothetical protein DB30_05908 [Enhygromyxa salina]
MLCATLTLGLACGDSTSGEGYTSAGDGDGDGDGDTTGDGDGDGDDTGTGDGDGDGDAIMIDPDNMIDNFEDGDGSLIPNGGRQGYWYTFNDATEGATQTPADDMVLPEAGGAAGTAMAMHTTGSGFAEWGAGIGIDLNNAGDPEGGNGIKMAYDASGFTGVVLRAKGNGQIRAAVQIEATIPPEEGGTCAMDCDPHGKVLLLSDEWQQFTLTFDQLNQEGWGTPAVWDASKIVGIQFKAAKNTEFDFWVDEIGLY